MLRKWCQLCRSLVVAGLVASLWLRCTLYVTPLWDNCIFSIWNFSLLCSFFIEKINSAEMATRLGILVMVNRQKKGSLMTWQACMSFGQYKVFYKNLLTFLECLPWYCQCQSQAKRGAPTPTGSNPDQKRAKIRSNASALFDGVATLFPVRALPVLTQGAAERLPRTEM